MPRIDVSEEYEREGFAMLPKALAEREVAALGQEADRLASMPTEDRVFETDGRTVRALHGCHRSSAVMDTLTRLPRLLGVATDLLNGDVYVYQFKINTKAAFNGGAWAWHQDYIYWRDEDGMPECRAINLVVFLDEVTESNGPLTVIPKSHVHGVMSTSCQPAKAGHSWRDNVAEDLKYVLPAADVAELLSASSPCALTGPAGSIVAFHPNIAHASQPNQSSRARRLLIVTYNRTDNAPTHASRPEFLVSRDTSPLFPSAVKHL